MDGFTVSRAQNFLQTASIGDRQGLSIHEGQNSQLETVGGSKGFENNQASFADTLKSAIQSVNELQQKSDKSMQDLATGRTDNVADVMIAAEKADIALRLMVQVRNKIIDAYQEVMKMQV